MQHTLSQIEEKIRSFHPDITSSVREDVLAYVAFQIQETPDILFFFLERGASTAIGVVDQILAALQEVDSCLDDALRSDKVNPSPMTKAASYAENIQRSLVDYGRYSEGHLEGLKDSLSRFHREVKSKAVVSGEMRRSGEEAKKVAESNLQTVFVGWSRLISLLSKVKVAETSFENCRIDAHGSIHLMKRIVEELNTAATYVEDDVSGAVLTSQVVQYLLDKSTKKPVFTGTKYDGNLNVYAPCTPAKAASSRSGPYRITGANDSFGLSAQGSSQVFTLPRSLAGKIKIGSGPFTLTAATKASSTATTVGPYTAPVEASGGDGAVTSGSRLFTSASSTFLTDAQVGDLLKLSGAYTGDYYITAIIDDTSLVLHAPASSTAASVTHNLYRSDKFTLDVRGVIYEVPLSTGAAVPYSTWESELSAALSGVATISSSGGLIKIEDAGAAGEESTVQVFSGMHQGLMGFPTTSSVGSRADNSISVETDAGADTKAVAAGTYTASALESAINALSPVGWSAVEEDGALFLSSNLYGPLSWIRMDSSFGGVGRGTRASGRDVSLEEIAKRINDTRSIGLVAERVRSSITSGASLVQTSASLTVTDASKDFSVLGVVVGDVLVIEEGPNQGVYHISSVGTTTLGLSSFDANASLWEAATSRYEVVKDTLLLTSTATSTNTAIGTPLHAEIGFTSVMHYGTTRNLSIPSQSPLDLGITTRDLVSSLSASIIAVSDTHIEIDQDIPSNTAAFSTTILPVGRKSFDDMISALSAWESTQLPKTPKEGAGAIVDHIVRAFKSKSPVYVGEARQSVTTLLYVLGDATEGLRQVLEKMVVPDFDGFEQLSQYLQDSGNSAMIDHLLYGSYRQAFSSSPMLSSTQGKLRGLLQNIIPYVGGNQREVSTLSMEEEYHVE